MLDFERYLVSRRFGVLQEVQVFRSPIYCDLFVSIALGHRRSSPHVSFGIDFSESAAKIKSISEGVERYASCIAKPKYLLRAKKLDLPEEAIGPSEFFLYSEQQNAEATRAPFTAETEINWLPFISQSGQKKFLPESAAFLNNYSDCDYIPTSSNGCAAGANAAQAKLNALLEVLERDAVMVHWRTSTAPKRIDLTIDQINDPETLRLFSNLPTQVLDVKIYLLETEFKVSTILVVGLGKQREWPAFISAAAAHPNKEIALKKSLLEFYLATTLFYKNLLHKLDLSADTKRQPEKIYSFSDHAQHYYFYNNQSALKSFLNGQHVVRYADIPSVDLSDEETLTCVYNGLTACDYTAYFFDHTTRDVAAQKLQVIRCVVPGLAMIHARHKDIMLNPIRFQKFLSFQKHNGPLVLNTNSHFFP